MTSHVSLMARALNIPAITGVGAPVTEIVEGIEILVDAVVGNVFVQPSAAVLEEYRRVLADPELSNESRAWLEPVAGVLEVVKADERLDVVVAGR